ncbi:MAG: LPS assembly lipoprotein LptE [Deferribacterales bacterium]
MKTKALLSVLLVTLFVYGCGYKIALTGRKASFAIYPASIENTSKEVNVEQLFTNEVKSYFASINALGRKDNTDNIGYITLTNVSSSSAVKLTSGQTATFDLSIVINVLVKDKSGAEKFSRNFGSIVTYSQTSSLSGSMANRNQAIKEAVRTALDNFRYEFENLR